MEDRRQNKDKSAKQYVLSTNLLEVVEYKMADS